MTNFIKLFKEYFVTIMFTVVVVFAICLFIELELLFRTETRVNNQEFAMENLAEFCTIDELEKKLLKEPGNYLINIKLAQIYESLEDYKKANELYEEALKMSSRADVVLYHYAMFCARHNLIAISTALSEEIVVDDKKSIEYKARIYEAIGDGFVKQKQNSAATKAYQVAYKYSKGLKNKALFSAVEEKFAQSYIDLADDYVKENEPEYAITNLKNSVKIMDNPSAKYKLALIYLKTDKVQSEKYMSDAFRANPFVVNPYIYNSLLEDLIIDAKNSGKTGTVNYYVMKSNKLKKKLKEAYVYKDEITIENSKIKFSKKYFSKKKEYYLEFDVSNNTKMRIEELHLQIELYVNSEKYIINRNLLTNAKMLDAEGFLNGVKVPLNKKIDFSNPMEVQDIIIKYYVKKNAIAPWVLVKIDAPKF